RAPQLSAPALAGVQRADHRHRHADRNRRRGQHLRLHRRRGRDIRSQDVNDYIREAIGADFTSKHFRTWGGTVAAALALGGEELPGSRRGQTMVFNAVLDEVARVLRNTRAVCRRCYVHPAVVETWLEGRLGAEIAAIRQRLPQLRGRSFTGPSHRGFWS